VDLSDFFCISGVELGAGCGSVSIRFRPNLTFSPHHAKILFEVMEKTASEMTEKTGNVEERLHY